MKQKMLIFALMMLIIGGLWGQASETFTNLPTDSQSTYLARSWTGDDDVTWTAQGARTDQTINGKAICWGNSGTRNVISPQYGGGMGTLTFSYVRAFTGTGARSLEVYVNDYLITEITVSSTSNDVIQFSSDINTSGNVVLEIRSTGAAQVKVDNIAWTAYGDAGVALPSISPNAGFYTEAQTIEITHEDNTANIYYTLNGDDPDDNSTEYTSSFQVSENTTVKAIAYVGGEASGIVTRNYTFPVVVNNLGELRNQTTGSTVYKVTGEVILTFAQTFRNQKYVQDDTGAVLIDDNPGTITTTYSEGDGIVGLIGTIGEYQGMLQFTPTMDPGTATSTGNTITPTVITVEQFTNNFEDYEAQLVTLQNMRFNNDGNFANGQVYPIIDPFDSPINFRTTFYSVDYITNAIPNQFVHITGILNENSNGKYLTSRNLADFSYDNTLPVTLSSFTAAVVANQTVSISWVTESESNLRGYHILRNENNSLESASRITPSLIAPNNTSTTNNYTHEDSEVYAGQEYYYWLQVHENDGTTEFFGPISVNIPEGEVVVDLPSLTAITNVYPNPMRANSNATFDVKVKDGETAALKIFNVKGQLVKQFDGIKSGNTSINWDGKDNTNRACATGIYFYQLSSPTFHSVQKMIIVK